MSRPPAASESVQQAASESVQLTSRVARKRSQRRDAILHGAAEVISEHGYQNTSLEMVAERVDLTKASLYHYFTSKEELISACFQAVAEKTIARLSAVAERAADDPLDALRSLIVEQLSIFVRDDPEMAGLFLQAHDWPTSMREEQRRWRGLHDAIFASVVEAGIEAGQMHPRDPRIALHCMHGAINFVPIWFRSKSPAADQRVLEAVTENILDTFRVEDRKDPR